jgi:DNA-binding NarL/FixJ family response regulator
MKLTLFKDDDLMDYLIHLPEIKLPHVLFLDLNMPSETGIDCLKEVQHSFKDVSIAIYSSSEKM